MTLEKFCPKKKGGGYRDTRIFINWVLQPGPCHRLSQRSVSVQTLQQEREEAEQLSLTAITFISSSQEALQEALHQQKQVESLSFSLSEENEHFNAGVKMNWSKSLDQFKTRKLYLIINHFQDASASAEIYPLLSHLTSQSYQNLALNPWFIGSAVRFPLSSSLCLFFTFLGWSLSSTQHFQSRCDFCLLLNVIFQSNKPTLLSIIIIKLTSQNVLIITLGYHISYRVSCNFILLIILRKLLLASSKLRRKCIKI